MGDDGKSEKVERGICGEETQCMVFPAGPYPDKTSFKHIIKLTVEESSVPGVVESVY